MEASTTEYTGAHPRVQLSSKLITLRQKLYCKAKKEPKFRFYTLYSHLQREDVLKAGWEMVWKNGGAAGVDGVKLEDVEPEKLLEEIRRELEARSYQPQAVRRVYIEKPGGGLRPLGIPVVKDRVVQAAVLLVLEPIFEADFCDTSYGFRPNKSQHQALEAAREHLRTEHKVVYDVDLQSYFDSIPHDKLMKCVEMRIVDQGILKLIRLWLKSVVAEKGDNGKPRMTRPRAGTPQGGVISPLLSNIYLHWFDKVFKRSRVSQEAKVVRFADDIRVFAKGTGPEVEKFLNGTLQDWMGLTINREKSRTVRLGGKKASVDFLGFTMRYDQDLHGRPWRYLNITPSKQAVQRAKLHIKEQTSSSMCFKPIKDMIDDLNKWSRGWKEYFSFGYPRAEFRRINHYLFKRVEGHLKRRSQRPYKPPPGVTFYTQLRNLGLNPM